MENAARNPRGIFTLALAFTLLCACATLPKAKPGLYVNQQHSFSVSYPENWQTQTVQHADEVLRAVSPTPHKLPVVTAAVADQRPGATLDPQAFTQVMQQRIPGSSGFKVLSQEDVTLNDSTPAKAFVFEWLWKDGQAKLMTAALITIKGGKYYSSTVTNVAGGSPGPEQLLNIVKSWKFY